MSRKIHINKYMLFWGILNLLVISWFIYQNLINWRIYIDSDIVAEMDYAQLVWKEKTIFPSTWYYGNELSFMRPALLAALIYGITNQFVFSYTLSISISIIIYWLSFYYIFKVLKFELEKRLVGCLISISIFGYVYSYGVLIGFAYLSWYMSVANFTIGWLVNRIINKGKKNNIVYLILMGLAFGAGVMGPRLLIFLYIPLVLGILEFNVLFKRKVSKDIFIVAGLCIASVLGILGNKILFLNSELITTNFTNLSWRNISDIVKNGISDVIISLAECIGVIGNNKIFSISGIDQGIKILLLGLIVILCVCYIKNKKDNMLSVLFFLNSIIVIALIQMFSTMVIIPRYYMFLIPLIIILILDNKIKVNSFPVLIILPTVIVINLYSYPSSINEDKDLEKISQYMIDNNIDIAYAPYWTAGKLKALSNGKVEMIHLYPENQESMEYNPGIFKWQTDGKLFVDDRINTADTPIYIVIDDDVEQLLYEDNRSILNIISCTKSFEQGKYNLYYLEDNPFYVINPQYTTYFPGILGQYLGDNTKVDKNSKIVSIGKKSGWAIWGPHIDVKPGSYDITVEMYSDSLVDKNIAIGLLDVSYNNGQNILESKQITGNDLLNGKVELKNLNVTEEVHNVEIRFQNYEGVSCKVGKIQINESNK